MYIWVNVYVCKSTYVLLNNEHVVYSTFEYNEPLADITNSLYICVELQIFFVR